MSEEQKKLITEVVGNMKHTQIGDEQTLKALCDVMDWDFDELKEQLKNADSHTAQDARTALGVILPDDPDNPDDEPVEE